MQKNIRLTISLLIVIAQVTMALFTVGCNVYESHTKGVYVLVDTSTGNADRLRVAINSLLGNLSSEDTLAVARIDSTAVGKKHVPTTVKFAQRPSIMAAQKRMFQKQISAIKPAQTDNCQADITGGLLQAVQFLNQIQSTQKIVLIASGLNNFRHEKDMKEKFFRLEGIEVFASDLTGQADTMLEAQQCRQRMDRLRTLIESGGGSLRVINDLTQFDFESNG